MTTDFVRRTAKRCGPALALAVAALSLAPPAALAAPTSPTDVADTTLTVGDLLPGDTVSAYLIADADIDAANNLTYAMAPGLPSAYDTIDEIAAVASDGTAFVQGSAMQNAASAIAASLNAPAVTATAAGASAQLSLGSGYYLVRVTSTSGQTRVYQNMIVDATPAVDGAAYKPRELAPVDVKKTDVAIDKGVGAQYGQSTDAYSVGDSVPFRVTTAVPSYPADSKDATFTIADTPSAGLEIDTSSIQINGVAAATGADYALSASPAGYTIAFSKAYVLAHPGEPVVVTYSAALTSAAFSRSADDLTGNTANITFNPNPYESTTATPADKTTVQTYGYVFKKTAPDGTPLAGAAFTIALTNGTSVTSTSDAQGYVYFEDLAAGTYTAVETTIPSGYQKAPDQTFELSSATATADNPATAETENNYLVATLDVQDPRLPTLPITGAAGVFLLVMVGAGLVVVGSVLGLRSRKEQ